MKRQFDFEMEFLISLILAVLGIEGTTATKVYVVDTISMVLTVAIFIHISVLILSYTANLSSKDITAPVESFNTVSRITIIGTFSIFLYFVLHLMLNFLFTNILAKSLPLAVFSVNVSHEMGQVIGFYVAPGLIVGVIWIVGYLQIFLPITISNDIEVSINPSTLRIYSDFSESNPLTVHIRNESTKDIQAQIEIEVPDGIEWRKVGTESNSSSDIDESIDVNGPGENTVSFDFRVVSGDRRSPPLPVLVDYDYGRERDEVVLTAIPGSHE